MHEGHLDHILRAAALGDFMYIVTHTDASTLRHKGSRYTTLSFRHFILSGILQNMKMYGLVLVTEEATVAYEIRQFKPDIFAKGGDRIPGNRQGGGQKEQG